MTQRPLLAPSRIVRGDAVRPDGWHRGAAGKFLSIYFPRG